MGRRSSLENNVLPDDRPPSDPAPAGGAKNATRLDADRADSSLDQVLNRAGRSLRTWSAKPSARISGETVRGKADPEAPAHRIMPDGDSASSKSRQLSQVLAIRLFSETAAPGCGDRCAGACRWFGQASLEPLCHARRYSGKATRSGVKTPSVVRARGVRCRRAVRRPTRLRPAKTPRR